MTDRKEFEAWILDRPNADLQCIKLDVDDHYDEYWEEQRWAGWQAAKALRAEGVANQTCETCRYFFIPSDNERWPSRCINPVVQELAYGRYFEPPAKFCCNKWEKS